MYDYQLRKHIGKIRLNSSSQAFRLGQMLSTGFKKQRIALATSVESSSSKLLAALNHGFAQQSNLNYLGEISYDMLIFALYRFNFKVGLHLINDDPHDPNIFALHIFATNDFVIDLTGITHQLNDEVTLDYKHDWHFASPVSFEFADEYITNQLRNLIGTNSEQKVVVDSGNGVGTVSVLEVLQAIPSVQVLPLHDELVATFPHHYPNPDFDINLTELQEQVKTQQANFGVAVGVEGTRVRIIDNEGNVVPEQYLAGLVIKYLNKHYPERNIVCEKSYQLLYQKIVQDNHYLLSCTLGQQNIGELMANSQALFGVDHQGWFYFSNSYYQPSGSQLVIYLLNLLSEAKRPLSALWKELAQKYPSSNRISYKLTYAGCWDKITHQLNDKYLTEHTKIESTAVAVDYPDWRAYIRRSSRFGEIIRIYIEAKDHWLVEHIEQEIRNMISGLSFPITEEFEVLTPEIANMSPRERAIAHYEDIYHTWNRHNEPDSLNLHGSHWVKLQPPGELIRKMDQTTFDKFWEQNRRWIDLNMRQRQIYLTERTDFYRLIEEDHDLTQLVNNPIAYFSMEFGLTSWLQIYSGGLGVLAGDYMKQASDLGLPAIGVGLLYHYGYFHQQVDSTGMQVEEYLAQSPEELGLAPVTNAAGEIITIDIPWPTGNLHVKGWWVQVGRNQLLLLDTNIAENENEEDKLITGHLYGGDKETRIRQEIVLGVAGYEMLLELGICPSISHLNEGHSAFAVFSIAANLVKLHEVSFTEALNQVSQRMVFTNHTLVPAGSDNFERELFNKYLGGLAHEWNSNVDELWQQGEYNNEFSMTQLGMRKSGKANAVSKLHSEMAKSMWPEHKLEPVTNGVHAGSWVGPQVHQLFDKYLGELWHDPRFDTDWSNLNTIAQDEMWQAHQSAKQQLISTLNQELGLKLSADKLLASWFRRFATYKRPDLLISDLEQLLTLIDKEGEMPMQIIIGGKAHPQDSSGKEIMQKIYQLTQDPRFHNQVVFVPGYNLKLARLLVAGSDVWINTPRRGQEASGTSGMKAAMNGVLQLTTADGWTDEVDWKDIGWIIPDEKPEQIYHILKRQIVPLYYQRSGGNVPRQWITQMLRTMGVVLPNYTAERMVVEYITKLYLPLLPN